MAQSGPITITLPSITPAEVPAQQPPVNQQEVDEVAGLANGFLRKEVQAHFVTCFEGKVAVRMRTGDMNTPEIMGRRRTGWQTGTVCVVRRMC